MSVVKSLFGGNDPKRPPPPPNTPRKADASLTETPTATFQSLIGTGSTSGLKRKASTGKRTLIGGSA